MRNYVGKYRVVCEFDRRDCKPLKEDTYIVCARDGQIYRYNSEILVYVGRVDLSKKLKSMGIELVDDVRYSDGERRVMFYEKDIEVVGSIVGARTLGCNIKPESVKNLRKLQWFIDNKQYYINNGYYKELSDEEREVLSQRAKENNKFRA